MLSLRERCRLLLFTQGHRGYLSWGREEWI